jgi:glyoxylase-like metal-dependent hydrolase (beta-lactamase superfamily II)
MNLVPETNNLIRLTRLGVFNCFLVREDDGFTLVDTCLAGSARGILSAAQRFGAPIRRIVLTHAHFDHVASLDALAAALPGVEISIGIREARLLAGDFSLDAGEPHNKLLGFIKVNARPSRTLLDGDRVGSLQAVFSPGHTPGHLAFLDARDGTLLAGDSFVNQMGVIAAGVFKPYFPMAAWFSWDRMSAAQSAKKLRDLKPTRLAVGHGKTVVAPGEKMSRTVELALRQCGNRRLN